MNYLPEEVQEAIRRIADYTVSVKEEFIESDAERHQLRAWVEVQCLVAIEDPDWESLHEINVDDVIKGEIG